MSSFAIIAEGVTDQVVLENILHGYFHADDREPPDVNYVQPPPTPRGAVPAPGGWTLVLRSLREGAHRRALQFNDYVVVHIDTDVCEDPGFDVSRRAADGRVLLPEELIERVKAKLIQTMGQELSEQDAKRIVFAIAVDSIECWLLPLLYDDAARRAKITGCLEAADWKLRRLGRPPLSRADNKDPLSYEKESRKYAKRRTLMEHRSENPSLDVFVSNLEVISRGVGEASEEGVAG